MLESDPDQVVFALVLLQETIKQWNGTNKR